MPRVHTISGATPVRFQAPSAASVPALHGLSQPIDVGPLRDEVRIGVTLGVGALGALGTTALLYGRGRGWAALGAGAGAALFGFLGRLLAVRLVGGTSS
jgi:hypothetical protein